MPIFCDIITLAGNGRSAGSSPCNWRSIETAGTLFHPEVTGVMTGQPFRIRSADPIQHNVAATSRSNGGFNVAVANQGQVDIKSFATPELFVKLTCNVHPWELCYICVEPHPFFSVTDADGRFVLPAGLPAGTYEVEAVHTVLPFPWALALLAIAGVSAALVSEWFVDAIDPAVEKLGISKAFTGRGSELADVA